MRRLLLGRHNGNRRERSYIDSESILKAKDKVASMGSCACLVVTVVMKERGKVGPSSAALETVIKE